MGGTGLAYRGSSLQHYFSAAVSGGPAPWSRTQGPLGWRLMFWDIELV